MKTLSFSIPALVVASSLLTACSADDGASPPDVSPAEAPAANGLSDDDAASTLLEGGDFRFSLADSGVHEILRKRCEQDPAAMDGPGTAAADATHTDKVKVCLANAEVSSKGEGVSFTPEGGNRMRFISYAHENGEKKVLIEALVTITPYEPGIVELTDGEVIIPKLPPEQLPKGRLLIEVVNDTTIAMDKFPGAHPRTGGARLVYHRAAR